MIHRALTRTQNRLNDILTKTPYSESLIQTLVSRRSAGALAPILEFYTKGNQIPPQTATTILSKYNARRDAVSYKVEHMAFKGQSSNGLVTVECTGSGKIIQIILSKQIAALPKSLQNDYIMSAFGNAMSMAHTILYEEQVKANNDAFDDLYDALEGYHENEFLSLTSRKSVIDGAQSVQLHTTNNYAAKKLSLAEHNEDPDAWLDQFTPNAEIPEVPKVGAPEDDFYHFADAWVGQKTGYHNEAAQYFLRNFAFHQQFLKLAYRDLLSGAKESGPLSDEQVAALREWKNETSSIIRNLQNFDVHRTMPTTNPIAQVVESRKAKLQVKKRLGVYADNYADKFENK